MGDILEALAEIEHDQWVSWSKDIAENEAISPARLKRWKALWIPYKDLPEETKESDREWARRVLRLALHDLIHNNRGTGEDITET